MKTVSTRKSASLKLVQKFNKLRAALSNKYDELHYFPERAHAQISTPLPINTAMLTHFY